MSGERIPVALLGMNERSLALLNMFFEGQGRKHFEVVEERRARAGIFDLDTPGSEKLWHAYHELYRWPCIVLSVRERKLPDAIWVQKPLVVDTLAEAAKQLGIELDRVSQPAAVQVVPESAPKSGWARLRALGSRRTGRDQAAQLSQTASAREPVQQPKAAAKPAPAEVVPLRPSLPVEAPLVAAKPAPRRTQTAGQRQDFCRENVREASPLNKQYCGFSADLDLGDAQLFYTSRGHFQSALTAAWRKAHEVRRRVLLRAMNEKFVLLCPNTGLATTNFSNKTLRSLCVMTLSRGDVSAELLGEKADAPRAPDAVTINADALLWNVALWTSKGRLPKGTDPASQVRLRHWPNFTRLTRTPHAMRIAALWAERGAGLGDTARLLGVPQRYVFAVYSAASALGLTELYEKPVEVSTAVEGHQHRGLFSRLLRRFAGQ